MHLVQHKAFVLQTLYDRNFFWGIVVNQICSIWSERLSNGKWIGKIFPSTAISFSNSFSNATGMML